VNHNNFYLRKDNLAAEVANLIAHSTQSVKLKITEALQLETKKCKPVIADSVAYYANAPRRSDATPSIDRQLKAQGNAW